MNRTVFFISLAAMFAAAAIGLAAEPGERCAFNEAAYLEMNPDVAAAVRDHRFESGRSHYERFGRNEGRPPNRGCPRETPAPQPQPKPVPKPQPAACTFNESEYLQLNPDVARAVSMGQFVSGRAHFESFGRGEGRAPSNGCPGTSTDKRTDFAFSRCDFNEQTYLLANPDVAQSVRIGRTQSGVWHYQTFGRAEHRKPYADCEKGSVTLQEISYGCGGGIAGDWREHSIRPDGTQARCHKANYSVGNVCEALPTNQALYTRLNALLDAAGFDALPEGAPASYTCLFVRGTKRVYNQRPGDGPLFEVAQALK